MVDRKEVLRLKKNSEQVGSVLMIIYLIACILIIKNLQNLSLFDIDAPLTTMLISALLFIVFGFLLGCTVSINLKKPIHFLFWLLLIVFLLIGLSQIIYYAVPAPWMGNLVVSLIEISPLGQIGLGCYLYILIVHIIMKNNSSNIGR